MLACLMVLFFIPVVGFFLYLIFGRRLSGQKIFTWDTKSKLGVRVAVHKQLKSLENDTFSLRQKSLMKYKDLYYLHLRHNDAIFTQDNEVQLFTYWKDKFISLINYLNSAKDNMHLH